MQTQEPYKVQLEVFEGPLDLLLYLIKKNEVEIHDIPIETITTQYMEYMNLMRMLDLNIAGDFLVMAATLMMIKSRMLLPEEERSEDQLDEEDDPRWDLVRQLVEYKKFKDAALFLEHQEFYQEDVFSREGEGVHLGSDEDAPLQDVSIFDLISAFQVALNRVEEETLTEIFHERVTVAEKIDHIVHLVKNQAEVCFGTLFPTGAGRHEIVCTFLAVLELIRLNQIQAQQSGKFGDIVIVQMAD